MRRLLILLLLIAPLLAAGCGDGANALRTQLSGKPFSIGPAEQYRKPGVYGDHVDQHGVWIVSFAGMVNALSAACPQDGKPLLFDPMTQQFKCSICDARFDSNGLPRAPDDAKAAMVRLRIEPVDKAARGADVELQVNGRFAFRYEENQWSNRFSLHVLGPAP